MPTLVAQTLSGLVVIPTVEDEGTMFRVSLGIDVGVSRVGTAPSPPQVVTREDLIVELKNSTDGSLEPVASPDPGPLPVRALRVRQARAEFTFAHGVNPPEEVVVTVRGDRKTFPMSQVSTPGPAFSQEPEVGAPFPGAPPGGGVVVPPRFPKLPFLPGGRCCGSRFETPLDVSEDPAAKSETFHMQASFANRVLLGCRCACCEYRQYVRGTFHDADGAAVRFDLPGGALSPHDYREDGAIDEFGPGSAGYYGHRKTSSPGDSYGGPDGSGGCAYRGNETVSCPPTDGAAQLEFIGLLVDVCRRRVSAKKKWVVNL